MNRIRIDDLKPSTETIAIVNRLFHPYIRESENIDGNTITYAEPMLIQLDWLDVEEEIKIKNKYGIRFSKTSLPKGTTTRTSIIVRVIAGIYEDTLLENKDKTPREILSALMEYDKAENLGHDWFFNMVLTLDFPVKLDTP